MNSHDIWQIFVQDRTYEASYDELIQWIKEGSILPEDKVKRGNLRWLDAGKIPELTNYFKNQVFENDAANFAALPEPATTQVFTHFQVGETNVQSELRANFGSGAFTNQPNEAQAELKICSIHPERDCFYVCEICGSFFCRDCPNTFGSSVKLCVSCGGMCIGYEEFEASGKKIVGAINKPYPRMETAAKLHENERIVTDTKLRKADFFEAFKNPFKFFPRLVFCSTFFAILVIGQIILAIGGSLLFSVAAMVSMLTTMLTFSVMAKTVENLRQEKIEAEFSPRLNRFTLWEDFIQPLFLGLGVYLVSFGLFAAIVISASVYAWFTFSGNLEKLETEMRQSNNTMSAKLKAAQTNRDNLPNAETKLFEIEERIEERLQDQFTNVFGSNYLADLSQLEKVIISFTHLSIYFQMPICFAFIFGLILFPAACSIAGSTRSFTKTINIFSEFSTIKRFGFDYIKILLMNICFSIIVVSVFIFVYQAFAVYDQHLAGIVSGVCIGSILIFYFWLVFSRIVGFALYKNMPGETAAA